MARAVGNDISKFDLVLEPEKAVKQIDFMIARVGYGIVPDSKYQEFAAIAKKYPDIIKIWLGYHYLSTAVPVSAQLDFVVGEVEKSAIKPVGFVVDFESYYNSMTLKFADEAWEMIQGLKAKLGIPIILYTNKWLYESFIAKTDHDWDSVLFWFSWPVSEVDVQIANPILPTGRKSWIFWQHTFKANGLEYGLGRSYAADLDVFNGDFESMKILFNIGDIIEPVEPVDENRFYQALLEIQKIIKETI